MAFSAPCPGHAGKIPPLLPGHPALLPPGRCGQSAPAHPPLPRRSEPSSPLPGWQSAPPAVPATGAAQKWPPPCTGQTPRFDTAPLRRRWFPPPAGTQSAHCGAGSFFHSAAVPAPGQWPCVRHDRRRAFCRDGMMQTPPRFFPGWAGHRHRCGKRWQFPFQNQTRRTAPTAWEKTPGNSALPVPAPNMPWSEAGLYLTPGCGAAPADLRLSSSFRIHSFL